jgi:hypothetical protein
MEFRGLSMHMVHMSGSSGSRSARKVICTIKHYNETKDKLFNFQYFFNFMSTISSYDWFEILYCFQYILKHCKWFLMKLDAVFFFFFFFFFFFWRKNAFCPKNHWLTKLNDDTVKIKWNTRGSWWPLIGYLAASSHIRANTRFILLHIEVSLRLFCSS